MRAKHKRARNIHKFACWSFLRKTLWPRVVFQVMHTHAFKQTLDQLEQLVASNYQTKKTGMTTETKQLQLEPIRTISWLRGESFFFHQKVKTTFWINQSSYEHDVSLRKKTRRKHDNKGRKKPVSENPVALQFLPGGHVTAGYFGINHLLAMSLFLLVFFPDFFPKIVTVMTLGVDMAWHFPMHWSLQKF